MGKNKSSSVATARARKGGQPAVPPTSLADALFTRTQQRLFALLFGQPDRSFFSSELITLTGSGSGAVQRELKSMSESGLVTVKSVGRQKHYQMNVNCPIHPELSSLVRKTFGLVEPIRAALSRYEQNIELALIFGSVAREAATAGSDVDLLIVADGLTLEALFAVLAPVEKELCRKINPTLYSRREFAKRRKEDNPFVTSVLVGKHIVLFGSADAHS